MPLQSDMQLYEEVVSLLHQSTLTPARKNILQDSKGCSNENDDGRKDTLVTPHRVCVLFVLSVCLVC